MAPTKEEIQEREHFKRVVHAFKNYGRDSKKRLDRTRAYYRVIPTKQRKVLETGGYENHLNNVENCIDDNDKIVQEFIDGVEKMFENIKHDNKDEQLKNDTSPMDVERVQSTIKQFVRDWSSEGEAEREMCYTPILDEIEEHFGEYNSAQRDKIQILVPGAGLGRLAYEIASRGYTCQGNEFSLFMLMGSNFVLNKSKGKDSNTIYPWVHQYTNNMKQEDQLKAVTFPDIDPANIPSSTRFSMLAGDFLEVYNANEYYGTQDCVVTCFFIDCAHNVVEFIDLIHKVLKPGGKWINFGPLLYHFADVAHEASIEPSYDIVKSVIERSGFKFLKEDMSRKATYCQNPASMLQYTYNCVFFTCMKKL